MLWFSAIAFLSEQWHDWSFVLKSKPYHHDCQHDGLGQKACQFQAALSKHNMLQLNVCYFFLLVEAVVTLFFIPTLLYEILWTKLFRFNTNFWCFIKGLEVVWEHKFSNFANIFICLSGWWATRSRSVINRHPTTLPSQPLEFLS